MAKGFEIECRVDVIETEQFIATNILEWRQFANLNQRIELEKLINAYNNIIQAHETDPSLKIDI